jgi:peptidoglycan/LPS O-acetylase OafA/YrhL
LIAALSYGTAVYEFVLQIALAYGVFWFALIPGGAIRRFNELGDYSYGLYIFAWPMMQTAFLIAPELSPHELFILSTPAILLAAAASWHWVERPALDAHGVVLDWVLRHQRRLSNLISATR